MTVGGAPGGARWALLLIRCLLLQTCVPQKNRCRMGWIMLIRVSAETSEGGKWGEGVSPLHLGSSWWVGSVRACLCVCISPCVCVCVFVCVYILCVYLSPVYVHVSASLSLSLILCKCFRVIFFLCSTAGKWSRTMTLEFYIPFLFCHLVVVLKISAVATAG